MAGFFQPIANVIARRRRESLLRQAQSWPVITAHLLKSAVVPRNPLAEGATAFQDSQVESAFYFTLVNHAAGSYFGGHLRGTPMSDSEAHRALKLLTEDLPVEIRYNPAIPDQSVALPDDNRGFPIVLWPG